MFQKNKGQTHSQPTLPTSKITSTASKPSQLASKITSYSKTSSPSQPTIDLTKPLTPSPQDDRFLLIILEEIQSSSSTSSKLNSKSATSSVKQGAILPEIEHRHDIFMLELVGIAGLAPESFNGGSLLNVPVVRGNDLQSNLPQIEGIAGAIDRSHPTKTNQRFNAVASGNQRFRQQALAKRIGALKRPWRVVGAAAGVLATRHGESLHHEQFHGIDDLGLPLL
jgi:hypothetical protein